MDHCLKNAQRTYLMQSVATLIRSHTHTLCVCVCVCVCVWSSNSHYRSRFFVKTGRDVTAECAECNEKTHWAGSLFAGLEKCKDVIITFLP